MGYSLEKLTNNLPKDKCIYTERETDGGKEHLELLKQKGVYPYDYMDSFSRFNERELPSPPRLVKTFTVF